MNRLAVDIDEVLVPFVEPMARWKGLKMPRRRGYAYVYRDMFGITDLESRELVLDFYETETFAALRPLQGSQEALGRLRAEGRKMYAVTGRQDPVRRKTEDWLDLHFPGIFDDVVLTNSFTDLEVSKVDVCRALNLGTLIDDNENTCLSMYEAGMKAVHFAGAGGSLYPWCECTAMSVLGWEEATAFLREKN